MTKLQITCEYCNKTYLTYNHKSRFCSVFCRTRIIKRKPAEKKEKICIHCNKSFYMSTSTIQQREKNCLIKYCGRECYTNHVKKVQRKCMNCSQDYLPQRNTIKFCSKKCWCDFRKKKNIAGYWYENGYKVLYIGEGKGIKEHIKLIQEKIGRKLNPNEHVHHINEIRDDNRPENLQLITRSEHSKLHRQKEIEKGKKFFGR